MHIALFADLKDIFDFLSSCVSLLVIAFFYMLVIGSNNRHYFLDIFYKAHISIHLVLLHKFK